VRRTNKPSFPAGQLELGTGSQSVHLLRKCAGLRAGPKFQLAHMEQCCQHLSITKGPVKLQLAGRPVSTTDYTYPDRVVPTPFPPTPCLFALLASSQPRFCFVCRRSQRPASLRFRRRRLRSTMHLLRSLRNPRRAGRECVSEACSREPCASSEGPRSSTALVEANERSSWIASVVTTARPLFTGTAFVRDRFANA